MTLPPWIRSRLRRAQTVLLRIKAFVRAHKVGCACAAVGICGGVPGFFVGCATGIFAELIFRRLREEKSAPQDKGAHHAQPFCPPQTADDLSAAYKTLGLTPDATLKEIKSAHRRLAAQYHPDSAGGNQERFLQIQQAYEKLMTARSCYVQ